MPTGLRASDAPVIQSLVSGDQRLLMRIGALLQGGVAVTRAVLEELPRHPPLRDLLMDRGLKAADDESFAAIAKERGCGDLGLVMALQGPDDQGQEWRVLSFDDEVDNPLAPEPEPEPDVAIASMASLLPSLDPSIRGPVEGLLSAQADDQRAAALEQLRYASPSLRLVSELMPMVLADGAELVRERAISLLVAAGAKPVVVDLIRALQLDDGVAIKRLSENIHGLSDDQLDLVVAAVLASLGRRKLTAGVIHLCSAIAPRLASHRGLERLIELMLPQARNLSLVSLIRALQAMDRQRVDNALRSLLGQGDELDARVIVLLARDADEHRADLMERGVDLLLSPGEEPTDRMALAAALRRMNRGTDLAERIAARGDAILESRESTVYWLLAELCRDGGVTEAEAAVLIGVIHTQLTRRPGPHMVAILEQMLPSLLPTTPAAREELVEPLAELVVRFRDQRSLDMIQEVVLSLGPAATRPLWNLLHEHPHAGVRRMAATILPELHAEADEATLSAAVDQLVTMAGRSTERREKGHCLEAAARMAQLPQVTDPSLSDRVDQASKGLGDQALAVWGHVAAGPHVDPERRAEILELLLVGITADLPDLPAEEFIDPNTQDTTYVLDSRLGSHTYSVPVMLQSLRRIGSSEHLPPQLLRRMVSELCRQWKRVSSWEVIWGPGNIQDLGSTLGSLAEQAGFPSSLRLQVAEVLLPRVTQLSIAATLARVFASDRNPALGELAARAAKALMQAASRDEFADDERGELADVIVDFLMVEDYGEDAEAVRRRLAGLLSTYRAHLTMRSRERLKTHLPVLGEAITERLSWL